MAEPIQIDRSFWSTFAADYWERKPEVFRNVLRTSAWTDDDVLHWLDTVTKQGAGHNIRLYAGGRLVVGSEVQRFAPRGGDLTSYVKSVSDSFGGDSCGIVVKNIHLYSSRLWSFFKDVAVDLVPHVGMPGLMVHSAMLMGNYTQTPFGIHRDDAGVVTFVVKGRKRMLVWPYEYFANRKDVIRFGESILADPEPFAQDAIVLEAGPGDIMYWPSSYWHVALETEEHVHATVSLGFWFTSSISDIVADVVRDALNVRLGEGAVFKGSWRSPTSTLPSEFESANTALNSLIETGEIHRRIQDHWTKRVEASGFTEVPLRRNRA